MIKILQKSLSHYLDLFDKGPFSFVRYQDGEWNCIRMGSGKMNAFHDFVPGVREDFVNTLKKPHLKDNYIYATVSLLNHGSVTNAIKRHVGTVDAIKWHASPVFTNNQKFGNFFPLIKRLRKMKVMIVGPKHLRKLEEKTFSYAHFFEIRPRNCYLDKSRIKDEILKHYSDGCLIAFSANILSNTLIYELYPIIGNKCYMIDFGVIWDIMCGIISRGDWKMRIKKDPTWADRMVKHALGEDGVDGPLPNPVYIPGDDQFKELIG